MRKNFLINSSADSSQTHGQNLNSGIPKQLQKQSNGQTPLTLVITERRTIIATMAPSPRTSTTKMTTVESQCSLMFFKQQHTVTRHLLKSMHLKQNRLQPSLQSLQMLSELIYAASVPVSDVDDKGIWHGNVLLNPEYTWETRSASRPGCLYWYAPLRKGTHDDPCISYYNYPHEHNEHLLQKPSTLERP